MSDLLSRDSQHYRVMDLLMNSNTRTIIGIARVLPATKSQVMLIAEKLLDMGYVRYVSDEVLEVTDSGVVNFSELEAAEHVAPVVPHRLFNPTGTYCGRELKLNSMRPGAYDAYNLPSLVNGKRVERKA